MRGATPAGFGAIAKCAALLQNSAIRKATREASDRTMRCGTIACDTAAEMVRTLLWDRYRRSPALHLPAASAIPPASCPNIP